MPATGCCRRWRSASCRSAFSDTVARLGGDEFGVLLEGVGEQRGSARVARRADRPLERPSRSMVARSRTASIGVAFSAAETRRQGAAQQRRSRHVPRQGGGQEPPRHLPAAHADAAARAAAAGGGYLSRDESKRSSFSNTSRSSTWYESLSVSRRWFAGAIPSAGVLMPAVHPGRSKRAARSSARAVGARAGVPRHARLARASLAPRAAARRQHLGRHLQHGELVERRRRRRSSESGLEPGNLVIELTEST